LKNEQNSLGATILARRYNSCSAVDLFCCSLFTVAGKVIYTLRILAVLSRRRSLNSMIIRAISHLLVLMRIVTNKISHRLLHLQINRIMCHS